MTDADALAEYPMSPSASESLLISVCYRSTSGSLYTQYTEKELSDLIDELSGKHFLLMGDFNYPGIDNSVHQMCLRVADCFF